MIVTTRLGQQIRLPDGYIALSDFGYGGIFTDYYANGEGRVISVYHGKQIRAKYQKVTYHKRDKVPLVRLQKIDKTGASYPVLLSTIRSLVTTGKASIRGKHLN